MWLVYLRFDDQRQVKAYHVTAENKKAVDEIVALREKLVEYAFFYARGTMKPKHVPNFHFYKQDEFVNRWQTAGCLSIRPNPRTKKPLNNYWITLVSRPRPAGISRATRCLFPPCGQI